MSELARLLATNKTRNAFEEAVAFSCSKLQERGRCRHVLDDCLKPRSSSEKAQLMDRHGLHDVQSSPSKTVLLKIRVFSGVEGSRVTSLL